MAFSMLKRLMCFTGGSAYQVAAVCANLSKWAVAEFVRAAVTYLIVVKVLQSFPLERS